MKKKILSVLLCLSMAVGVLAGCGSEKKSAEENTVKVTKKLEQQYIERIEAYQEYFDEIRDKYSEYDFGATITLDSDGLPLMWLILGDSDSWDGVQATQLIGVDQKGAKVLAERGDAICPYRGQLIMAMGSSDDEYEDDPIYLYDEEKMDFVSVTDGVKPLSNDLDTIYSKEELNEKLETVPQMLECINFFETVRIAFNEETHQVVYLGRSKPDYYYRTLANLGVLLPIRYSEVREPDIMGSYPVVGLALRKEYAENKDVLNYFKQLEDAELDEDVRNELLSDEEATIYIYDNIIKAVPDGAYMLPDGTICTAEEAKDYNNKISIFMEKDDNWRYEGGEAGEYFSELDVERILRELQKKPIYSQEELFTYIVSVGYNCEIIEVDLNDCILKNASNNYICEVVRNYIGRINGVAQSYIVRDDSSFFTDELVSNLDSLSETEPYNTIRDKGIDSLSFEDNVITLTCYDKSQYQFQIEFNETGDKISKIEYIDPMASMSEEEKLAYVVKTEILPAYENYANNYVDNYSFSFIYLDDDEIPELVLRGDSEAAGNIICTYHNGSVVEMYTSRLYFDYLEKQGLLCNSDGNMGYYYDNVYNLKDGQFTKIAEGNYGEAYDADGNLVTDENGNLAFEYSWNSQQVTADKYDELLELVFNEEGATSVHDLEFYSSVADAYNSIVVNQ